MGTRVNRASGGWLAVTVVLAGAAIAWWPRAGAADDGVINGCYQKNQGQLRIVAAGTPCRPDENAISWNIQGPKGDPGPQGPAGGISGLERVDYSSANDSTSPKHAFAKCPAGKQVVGGGAQVFMQGQENGSVAVKKSFPNKAGDGWAATAEEMVATDVNWFLTAYALCAPMAQ